jgi:Protein of unknown function (DUF2959)
MRKHSQARMEDTRLRYEEILKRASAARVAYDAFNADLKDHALFLAHDFNTAAVESLAGEVVKLGDEHVELSTRLDLCVDSAKNYVEYAALRGQIGVEGSEVKPADPRPATRAETTAQAQTQTQRPSTVRRRATTTPAPEVTPTPTAPAATETGAPQAPAAQPPASTTPAPVTTTPAQGTTGTTTPPASTTTPPATSTTTTPPASTTTGANTAPQRG